MRRHPVVLPLVLAFLPLLLNAKIVLQHPAQDEVISTMAADLQAFLELPQAERRRYFSDPANRARLNQLRDAQPYVFQWVCTEGEKGDFSVVISERDDFSVPSPALVLPPKTPSATTEKTLAEHPNEARVANFLIGRIYYWKVEGRGPDGQKVVSAASRFRTDALPPRLLAIPEVGNVRDLGGRYGLDGRRTRQGLIFRSAGLNDNSPDFDWDRTKWKGDKVENFRIGANRLTPGSLAYVTQVLKWRTDLDLRSAGEVGAMTASPAGPVVKWAHHSSSAYGAIFGNEGSCTGEGPEAMAKNFRVFCDQANYPVEIHCIAGADRTGALAYVLNGVLGVGKDELEKDWEITANDYFNHETMFNHLAGGFDRFGAPAEPLHKKIEAYLLKIGITPEEIAAFRAIMLED